MSRQELGTVSPVLCGEWSSTVSYVHLNVVAHNGSSYIAKLASVAVEPGVASNWTSYWMCLSQKGEKGDQGEQGIQGERGLAATIRIGDVKYSDTDTGVSNSGTSTDAVFDITFPAIQSIVSGIAYKWNNVGSIILDLSDMLVENELYVVAVGVPDESTGNYIAYHGVLWYTGRDVVQVSPDFSIRFSNGNVQVWGTSTDSAYAGNHSIMIRRIGSPVIGIARN